MRRVTGLVAFAICAISISAAPAAGGTTKSWAGPQIKLVTTLGLFRGDAAAFRAEAPLTRQSLAHAVAKLTGTTETKVESPGAPVSLSELDATLVQAVGLTDAASRFYLVAQRRGLQPPTRFGTEVVARLLGLRFNHPAGTDELELQPDQIATRAEAAYSIAQLARFVSPAAGPVDFSQSGPVQAVNARAATFELPELTPWQARILGAAVSYIGFPYVWGGTGEGTPGFDCSGFVWRTYKLTPYADELTLADTLRGRTTMAMSGEVPRAARIGFKDLQPGDVLFFGKGPRSKPAQIDHTGINLGGGWFIHSSRYGVAVASLDGWQRSSFAWARRPLAEAGLA